MQLITIIVMLHDNWNHVLLIKYSASHNHQNIILWLWSMTKLIKAVINSAYRRTALPY